MIHAPEAVQLNLTISNCEVCHFRREPRSPLLLHACIYLVLAFCAAQRLRCASAIRLRASGLSTRAFLAFTGAFLALRPFALDEPPEPASRARTWVSFAISESIWASIESIAIALRITHTSRFD